MTERRWSAGRLPALTRRIGMIGGMPAFARLPPEPN
jgi:hypothetical protein